MADKKRILSIADGVAGLALIAWFFLPVATGPLRGADPGVRFMPFSMPMTFAAALPGSFAGILLFAVYLVPAFGLFSALCVFLGDRLGPFGRADGLFSSLLRILSAAIMVYVFTIPVLAFADSPAYFAQMPPIAYVLGALGLAWSVVAVIILLKSLNQRNPFIREYRAFKKSMKDITEADSKPTFIEILFRIRTKLFFAFIGIISFILIVLSVILLNNYRATIIKAVGDGARSQIEQAASIYRVNLGDSVAMFEYMNKQVEINSRAEFAYDSLTIYTNLKADAFLDALPASLPEFKAEFSTLDKDTQYPAIPPLDPALAADLAASFSKSKNAVNRYDSQARARIFVAPILKVETEKRGEERVKRERLLGFSAMTFKESVIMKPYFRTQNTVIALTTIFLYLAIVLIYVVGNLIVNPLLFLRMNVRKISDSLRSMIRGQARVSANTLVYANVVESRDEIQQLSGEIGDMVTVIRGIIPYISASTLKQAEKGTASSTDRELTFLFTDIRGFTTLCEGMQPDQVVSVLNRYLDLETEIILENHGDVDKFVGDEMMAFFDGPDKEINACRAAMQIRHAMMAEKEKREKEGLPIVAIGIGINTGHVVFGSVGARERMDFTSIGDTVNLAARLEGQNKQYSSKAIITEAVYERVKEHFLCRELDFIAVKGKTEPVRIFEILQEIPKAQPKLVQIKETFEKGLAAYRKQAWKVAAAAFKKNIDDFKDGPSEVFLARSIYFSKNPPGPDWDGVYRATEK